MTAKYFPNQFVKREKLNKAKLYPLGEYEGVFSAMIFEMGFETLVEMGLEDRCEDFPEKKKKNKVR
ncbi:hypothetical protein [Vibrio stylophorae]|uniref:hypothetical protein n=1 Tax=Vibrio stylophorae TaxID=659351 RepID=UPI001F1886B7|nr:hypothetical protein [Vibrio stylophorae]